MSDWYGAKTHTVGIIGGGRAGNGLLKFFRGSQVATVAFVVDPNVEAPAMVTAKAEDIRTFTSLSEAFHRAPCDLVFEVTGKDRRHRGTGPARRRDQLPHRLPSRGAGWSSRCRTRTWRTSGPASRSPSTRSRPRSTRASKAAATSSRGSTRSCPACRCWLSTPASRLPRWASTARASWWSRTT